MTRKSPAETDNSLVSLGASLQFTFGDRLVIRSCAVLIAVLASATALFAQANEFREKVLPSTSGTRIDAAFASSDDAFRTSQTSSGPTTGEAAPLAVNEPVAAEKTPIRRPGGVAAQASTAAGRTSIVWIIIFALIAAAGGVSIWARRHPSARGGRLPENVFQVLGRQQIGPGQSVVFARLGDRVLLLSATSDGLRTLVDIDDPAEATRLTAECLAVASRGGRQTATQRVQLAPNTSPATAPSFPPAVSRIEQPRAANPASNIAGDHMRDVAARPDRLALARSRERDHG